MSVNESEERLLNSTKKTFLSMWSHSNIFYKKGKEKSHGIDGIKVLSKAA